MYVSPVIIKLIESILDKSILVNEKIIRKVKNQTLNKVQPE